MKESRKFTISKLALQIGFWTSGFLALLGNSYLLILAGVPSIDALTTKEECKDLVHIMIQEVGVDVEIKRVLCVKARPDYEPLFSILDSMRHDADRRLWIESIVTSEDNCDVDENTGQVSTGVEIVLQMSRNTLTRTEEYAP